MDTGAHLLIVGDIAIVIEVHESVARDRIVEGQCDHHEQQPQQQRALSGERNIPPACWTAILFSILGSIFLSIIGSAGTRAMASFDFKCAGRAGGCENRFTSSLHNLSTQP